MNLIDHNISKEKIPKHLAIIMDGNGRWAKQKGLMRSFGHEKGSKSVKVVVKTCVQFGIEYLTLYAFSTENWQRPKLEVEMLMKLLINSLKNELHFLMENNIRLNSIGNIKKLPESAQKELFDVIEKTRNNTGIILTLALSYGAREEIIHAIKKIGDQIKNNTLLIDTINESTINNHLYTQNLPDVDLLIRTSGEHRISNFLLWQIAYAEFYFTDVLWPDFKEKDLYDAIVNYQKRERRFGKINEQIK